MIETPPFSFLHCADLHLDSPFRGLGAVSPTIAEVLRSASFDALDALVQRALDTEVDFVIFAGDVYDGEDRSLTAQLRLRSALERLSAGGIESFIGHGNHDPLSSWQGGLELPQGVHRFTGDEVTTFKVERRGQVVAQLHGYSYNRQDQTQNPLDYFPPRSEPWFSIGVLHTNVGGQPGHDNYAPCTLEELAAREVDYWALGHVHRRQVLRSGDPWVVYPGFVQGRSIRELGPGGCYRVEVGQQGSIRLHFERLDRVTWTLTDLDLSSLETQDQLLTSAIEAREALRRKSSASDSARDPRPLVQRLRLVGRTPLHAPLAHAKLRRQLLEALRDGEEERPDFIWTESLEIRTQTVLDLAARRREEDFIGELLRASEQLRRRDDAAAEIRHRLSQRPEARLVAERLDALADDELLALLDDAETLALDLLEP